jgi:hypothetical protein
MIGGAIAVLPLAGYFVAVHYGPEHWRINAQGKAAYVALDELHTSIQTPIGRDEYGQCVRRAVLKVKPYMESPNAKSCPTFADWIGKSTVCYAAAAECWNEPVPEYETTLVGERLKYKIREEQVKMKWIIGRLCLLNAKCIMEGTPHKMHALTKDEMEEMSPNRRDQQ